MTAAPLDLLDATPTPLIDIRLSPRRSMSVNGQMTLLAALASISLAVSMVFVIAGYWPVAPFIGLDFALVAFAFHAVRRSARAYERVVVTPGEILIRQGDGDLVVREARMPTLWTRLERNDHPEFGCRELRLRHRGLSATVADMLSPAERAEFADLLSEALARARRGGLAALEPVLTPSCKRAEP